MRGLSSLLIVFAALPLEAAAARWEFEKDEVARYVIRSERPAVRRDADPMPTTIQLPPAVMVRAEHSCMCIRGIRKPGSSTVTCALRGVFKTDAASRAEIMALINNG